MKPDDKKFILENMDKKSIQEIAQELNLHPNSVIQFLDKEKKRRSFSASAPLLREFMKRPADQKTASISIRKYSFLPLVAIFILGFTVYANSLNGKFIWDDDILVVANNYVKNLSYLPNLFTENVGAGTKGKGEFYFYRPIQMVSYSFDYLVWKLDVRGYHFTNILLHILVALCIFWFIEIIYESKMLAFLTSIFFVANPLHTEAVDYIAGRADPLYALFLFVCLIFYVKFNNTKKLSFFILSLLSYAVSLFSKENALVLPLLILWYHYVFRKKFRLQQLMPFLGITLAYIPLRLAILNDSTLKPMASFSLSQRIPGFFVAIFHYLKLLVLPFNLHMEYGPGGFAITDPRVWAGILIMILLIVILWLRRNSGGLVLFAGGWFLITLLPQSNLFPINAYMAEHWLYLPSIGYFLLFSKGLLDLYRHKRFKMVAFILSIFFVVAYSFMTIRQASYWKDPAYFFKRTLEFNPKSERLYYLLGFFYDKSGNSEEAIALYKKAIELDPNDVEVYKGLGTANCNLKEYAEGIRWYEKALELRPKYAEAYNDLGTAYYALGNIDKAAESCEMSLKINPDFALAYFNLGKIYRRLGDQERADAYDQKAKTIDPSLFDGLAAI